MKWVNDRTDDSHYLLVIREIAQICSFYVYSLVVYIGLFHCFSA